MKPSENNQRIFAAVVSVKSREHRNDQDGYVVAVSGDRARAELEREMAGRHLDDWGGCPLDPDGRYPALMVWEGEINHTEDDVQFYGQWRKPTAAEIVALQKAGDPFAAFANRRDA